MTLRQWTLIAILSVLWGGSFFFNAIATREIQPFTLVFWRVGGGALVLIIIAFASGYRPPVSVKEWTNFVVMAALANAIPFVLIAFAQSRITSSLASVLNASTPLWTVLIAHVFAGDEKATAERIVGVSVGISGVASLVGLQAIDGSWRSLSGMLAMIGATVCYGFAGLWGRRFSTVAPIITSAGQLACSTLLLAPFALAFEHPLSMPLPSTSAIAAVLGLAVLSTALAFVIFFRVMAEAGATNALLVTLLVPLSATLLSVLVLHEEFTQRQMWGGVLIAIALLIIDGRIWSQISRRVV